LHQAQKHVEDAKAELKELRALLDPKSSNWQRNGCGYRKNFPALSLPNGSIPSVAETCVPSPRCQGKAFSPYEK
jgi:hypothetical protein